MTNCEIWLRHPSKHQRLCKRLLRARRKLLKYLDSGRIDLIGSDCHNLGTRPPDYADGAAVIVKKFGDSALQALIQNAHTLLGC